MRAIFVSTACLLAAASFGQVSDLNLSYKFSSATVSVQTVTEPSWLIQARQKPVEEFPVIAMMDHKVEGRFRPELSQLRFDLLSDRRDFSGAVNSGPNAAFPGPGINGWIPADLNVSVGKNHVLATVNCYIEWYAKDGSRQFSASMQNFFDGMPVPGGGDNRSFYDPHADRYFVSSDVGDYVLLAVSDDGDPNGFWTKWAIPMRYIPGYGDTHNWADYAGLGFGPDSIQVSANMYPSDSQGHFTGQVVCIPKQQLLEGKSNLTLHYWWDMYSEGYWIYSIQPTRHLSPVPAPFFVSNGAGYQIHIISINNPNGTPTLTGKRVDVTRWYGPGNVTQKNDGRNPPQISAVDDRVMETTCRNGRLLVVNNQNGGSGSLSKWAEIDVSSWPNSLKIVQDATAKDGNRSLWFPAAVSNNYGSIAVGFSLAGPDDWPSVAFGWRKSYDPPGSLREIRVEKPGTRAYWGEGGSVVRWGDYSGITLDPVDQHTFWGFNMYPRSDGWWQSWIWSFSPPDNYDLWLYAQEFTISEGRLLGGRVESLWETDGECLLIGSSIPPVDAGGLRSAILDVPFKVNSNGVHQLSVNVEGFANIAGVEAELWLYNWNAADWDKPFANVRLDLANKALYRGDIPSPNSYVRDSDGNILARLILRSNRRSALFTTYLDAFQFRVIY